MIRHLFNMLRYTYAGTRIILGRADLGISEKMQAINELRRRYGLKEWNL